MVSIAESGIWLGIKAGTPIGYRGLQIVPLVGRSSDDPSYRLFDERTAGEVEVTEVHGAGSVPDLRVKNRLGERVLLIDGQHLIGAKQNRILNADVLIAAGSEVTVPVSCVERGRWAWAAPAFKSSGMAHAQLRAKKAAYIQSSLEVGAGYRSDQGGVWEEVDDMIAKLKVKSSTAAVADAYREREGDLAEARRALEMPADAIGVAVYEGGRFIGLDLFDRASTFAGFWKPLMDSYVLDKLAAQAEPDAPPANAPDAAAAAGGLLEELARSDWRRFDAAGEGADLRLDREELLASALVFGDAAVLHVQAFPRTRDRTEREPIDIVTRHAEPSVRRAEAVPHRTGDPSAKRCPTCGFVYGMVSTPEGDHCNHCGAGPASPR